MSRLWRKIHQKSPEIATEMTKAMIKPNRLVSIPLMRFIPNKLAMRVGNIMRIDTDVSVRITVFMLLLMMDE